MTERHFDTAAEFRKYWKKAMNWNKYDKEYKTLELHYGDGTVDVTARIKPGVTAAKAVRWLIRKPFNADDTNHRDFVRMADIDARGGCKVVITLTEQT
jgi:hypothetical protein